MVVYTPGTLPEVVGQEIYSLMETCDNDFVPPLSSRSQIGQEDWTERAASANVDMYFDSLVARTHIVTARRGNDLAGFCAYERPYTWFNREYLYVSTAVVAPSWRGRGVSREFMTPVLRAALVSRLPILAKTWSTNEASMSVLSHHGTPLMRVPADRGLGIDTVYWSTSPARLCAKMVASGVQSHLRRQIFNALARIQDARPKPPHVPHHSVTDCDAEPD